MRNDTESTERGETMTAADRICLWISGAVLLALALALSGCGGGGGGGVVGGLESEYVDAVFSGTRQ